MTVTISLPLLISALVSFGLFVAVTVFAFTAGLFDGDSLGVGVLFLAILYAVFWAVPSLAGWAIYVTWLT